jgi:hypothetical protein
MTPVLNRSFLSFFLVMGSLCLVSWVAEGAAQKTSDTESAEALLQAGKLTEKASVSEAIDLADEDTPDRG